VSRLILELKQGESVPLDGGRFKLTLDKKRGRTARIMVDAPEDAKIGKRSKGLTQPPPEVVPKK